MKMVLLTPVLTAILQFWICSVCAATQKMHVEKRLISFCSEENQTQFQIVSARFDDSGESFDSEQLIAVYQCPDSDAERLKTQAKLQQRGNFTISYICAKGTSSVNPCLSRFQGFRDSVIIPSIGDQCFRRCVFTSASGEEIIKQLNVTSNILFRQGRSGENDVEYRVSRAGEREERWKCRESAYQETSHRDVSSVTVRVLLRKPSSLVRLWLSWTGAELNLDCQVTDAGVKTEGGCQRKRANTTSTSSSTTVVESVESVTSPGTLNTADKKGPPPPAPSQD